MRTGFLFDQDKCVGCSACKAGCFIENGWQVSVREIFTESIISSSSGTVTNLSLACNHCENAVCMEGCPASCFSRDKNSGAVLIDENKCIGCRYCTWNCPYDAPKFDTVNKTIVKCNLCVSRLSLGFSPACTLACPTGALTFGEIGNDTDVKNQKWLPGKDLNPSFEITGSQIRKPVRIIPTDRFDNVDSIISEKELKIGDKWSLAAFSFITMLSVSVVGAALFKGVFPGILAIAPLLFLAMISSLFHLGKWTRAWRALSNTPRSPLSREILFFILFTCLSLTATVFRVPFLMPVSAITGLLLLITIDRVYIFADNRKRVYLHSGQTFSAALLIISYASGMVLPFVFIAVIRLASSLYLHSISKKPRSAEFLRFLRIASLIMAGAGFISGNNYPGGVVMFLLLAGELADRLLFYVDFSPIDIKTISENHLNESQNEK